MKIDKTYNEFVREIIDEYRNIELELILKVAEMFKNYQNIQDIRFIELLNNFQSINEDTLKIIAEMSDKPLELIKKKMTEIGYLSLNTKELVIGYEKGLVAVDPRSVNYINVLNYHLSNIDKEMVYIQNKVKQGLYKDTYREIKKAQLSVELGYKSPNEAIVEAVKELAAKGIEGDSFLRQGKEVKQNMEGVVRRSVRTSFTNTMADMNNKLGTELGAEHWYMKQHLGARTTGTGYENHAKWQGKVYSKDELYTVCGKDEPRGYLGYNCQHLARPHIKGVSIEPPPLLNMEEMERVYNLEQKQRAYERDIRDSKIIIKALEVLETEESNQAVRDEEKKLRNKQKRLREYIKENEDVLRRDYSRERINVK